MDCEQVRQVLSARLDGEDPGGEAATVDSHLAGCAACRDWLAAAQRLARHSRLVAAPQVPDRTEKILAAAQAERCAPAPADETRGRPARLGLVAVATIQVALTVPALIFGHDHAAPMHVAHELGSFDLALAAGFLAAARRPARAAGMLPLVGIAALCLIGTAAADLVGGHTDVVDEAPHLLAVVGWLLLRRLAGGGRPAPPAPMPAVSLRDLAARWRRGLAALRREVFGLTARRVKARQRRCDGAGHWLRPARLGGLAAALLLALLSVLAVARPASAHAVLEHTSPASGAVLAHPPRQVSLAFGEPVTFEAGAIKVYDRHLDRVDSGRVFHPGGQAKTVSVHLKAKLGQGTYTVTWRVISADSHPVSGGFRFSIGHASATAGAAPTSSGGSGLVGVLLGIARFAGFAGIVAGLGALAVLVGLWPAGRTDRRARAIVWAGYGLLAVGAIGGLLLEGPYGAGAPITRTLDAGLLSDTIGTRFGQVHLVELGLLVPLAAALYGLLHRHRAKPQTSADLAAGGARPPAAVAAVAGLVGLGVLITIGLSGHAGTGARVPLAMASDVAHLAAIGVWLGGLVLLGVCLLPRRRAGELAQVLPRFSTVAFTAVVLIVVTGGYQSWRNVRFLPAFPDTVYGRLLMAKIVGFLVLVALGNLARRWIGRRYTGSAIHRLLAPRTTAHAAGPNSSTRELAPQATPSRRDVTALRRGLAGELVVGAAVLGLTTVLVNTAQARETYTPAYASTAHSSAGALHVRLARPQTGTRTLRLAVTDPAGHPKPVRRASGSLRLPARHVGPLPVHFHHGRHPGQLVARARFPAAGSWRLDVTVQTAAFAATAYQVSIPIRGQTPD
jgi:copper transport protein